MANKTLSETGPNPFVQITDYIYTEKPAGTFKTTLDQFDMFVNTNNVVGPAAAVHNAIPSFNGTTGKLIQNTPASIDAVGMITSTNFTVNGTEQLNGALNVTGNTILNTSTTAGAAQFNSTVLLAADPTLPLQAVTKQYIDNTIVFGDVDGPLTSTNRGISNYMGLTGKFLQDSQETVDTLGRITLRLDPLNPLDMATKQYVDNIPATFIQIPNYAGFRLSGSTLFVPANTDIVVAMNVKCFDTTSSYNTTTGVYTCAVAGIYHVKFVCTFICIVPALSGDYFLLRIYVNGVEKSRGYLQIGVTLSTTIIPMSVEYISETALSVGDTITAIVFTFHLTGSAIAVGVSGDERDSSLMIEMLPNSIHGGLIS